MSQERKVTLLYLVRFERTVNVNDPEVAVTEAIARVNQEVGFTLGDPIAVTVEHDYDKVTCTSEDCGHVFKPVNHERDYARIADIAVSGARRCRPGEHSAGWSMGLRCTRCGEVD